MSLTPYIDNRWNLDAQNIGVLPDVLRKRQFAYRIWREDFDRNQKREDAKKSEIKDSWTQIYQLIGFDNVFQGVWFQGATQLAVQRGCRFSALPIILSVFVSLATIVSVYLKTSKLPALEESLHNDQLVSKGLDSFIKACELEGVNFDVDRISAAADTSICHLEINFQKTSSVKKRNRILLLVSMTIASILFAWLIHLVMCGQYE